MIITINSLSLANGLEIIKQVVTSNKILPVCNNVKLETKGDVITLTGDSTSHTIITNVACACEPGFACLIPFIDLYNLVTSIPSGDVEIVFKDKQVTINAENGTYVIDETDDVMYFPEARLLDNPINVAVLQSSYIDQIHNKSVKFAHQDPAYFNMNDVCFEFTGEQLNVVATNVVSISKFSIPCPLTTKGRYLIQKKALELMVSPFAYTGEVWFKFSETKVQIENQDTVLICPLVDQVFPDFTNIFLQEFKTIEVPRKELLKSLSRASKFGGVQSVGLIAGSKLEIIGNNNEKGKSFEESVIVMDSQLQEEVKVGIIISQIVDALNACVTDSILIGLVDDSKPIIIKEAGYDNFIYQVAPIKYFQ